MSDSGVTNNYFKLFSLNLSPVTCNLEDSFVYYIIQLLETVILVNNKLSNFLL